jgi:hypothetical protein
MSHRISAQIESASGQALRGIEYWVKLDAATQAGFEAMSGTDLDLASIMEGILAFSRSQPVIIQSMLCTSPIRPLPGSAGAAALASRIAELVASGARINALQLYTVARTTTEPDILPCTDDEMRHAGRIVRDSIPVSVQVRVYGERGLLR